MSFKLERIWPMMGVFMAMVIGRLPAADDSQKPTAAPPSSPPPPAPPKLALLKPPPAGAGTLPWLPDYLRVLERFPFAHARSWHDLEAGGEALGYYGSGDRAGAAAQAQALLALAYLAGEPGYDLRPSGIPAAALRDQAVRSFRHLLRTHVTGDRDRVGGGRWGDDALAGLVIGPLAAASRLMTTQLEPRDTAGLGRVLAHEADRLLGQAPAAGRPRDSRAGENAAAVECLAWAVALFPNHPNAPRWEQQVRLFATNTLSAPQDRAAEAVVDGQPVREWVRTENLLPEYLLESGGAVDPGAALATLGSLSNGYFAYAGRGHPVPQALTHHYEDTWNAARRFWLGSRFMHPAGSGTQSGQDVALFPVTALLEWVGSEPSVARRIERSGFQALEAGQMARGDGSFFGAGPDEEAAAAGSLALAALIHRQHGTLIPPVEPEPLRRQSGGAWTSPAAALAVARSQSCFASWSWRSQGQPMAPLGLFVPFDAESLAAWGPNQLAGSFDLDGFTTERTVRHQERTVEGGFTATGQIEEGRKEGKSGLHHFVAFAALPAQRIAVLFDLASAAQAVTVNRNEGLHLRLTVPAGDSFRHRLRSEEGELALPPPETGPDPADHSIASSWLNVDDRLGIAALYSQEAFTLRMTRSAGAATAVIDDPLTARPVAYQPRQIVRDTVMLLIAGDAAATTRLARAGAVLPTGSELVRAVVVSGADGNRCLVAANFGPKETTVTLRPPAAAPLIDLRLAPLDTTVLPIER